jgi:hypothetical protein
MAASDYRWWVYWPVHVFCRLVAGPVDRVERLHTRQAEARWFSARTGDAGAARPRR